jgi:hypothetical protein
MPIRLPSLEAARRLVSWQFADEATVHRLTRVSDGAGGSTDSYVAGTTYPCSFSPYPITPVERESTTQVQTIVFWRFLFPHDADIRPTDRLMVGTRTFEVINAGAGTINITLQAITQEIT